MPASLARLIVRRRRVVLVLAMVFMAVAGAFGGSVAKHLSNGGFEDPTAESSRARQFIDANFGGGTANLVLLVTAADGRVDSAASAAAGAVLTADLARPDHFQSGGAGRAVGAPGAANSRWSAVESPIPFRVRFVRDPETAGPEPSHSSRHVCN